MTYDPKFTQKQMYDQYGSSRNTTTSKPNPGKQFADSMKAGGGGRNMSGIGAKPVSKPFERGSSYDEVPTPTPSKPEDPSNIEKVKNKFVELVKFFGGDEPEEVKVDGKAVYKGPMFTNTPIDLDAQMARINDAVDYSKAPPVYYGNIPNDANMRYDVVPSPTVNPNLQRNAINRIIKNLSPNSKEYTIKRDDTLSEIAQKEGVSVADLAKVNKIDNVDLIVAGETIIIPKPQEVERIKDFVDSVDPDAQFSQSGVPMDQRIFAPEDLSDLNNPQTRQGLMFTSDRPDVTVTELAPVMGGYDEAPLKTLGLMSPPRPQPVDAITASTKEKTDFVNTFVERMGSVDEGREDHTDSLGITTLGYGVLPATASSLGYDPDSEEYQDRKKLATAVYSDMYDTARATYPRVFNNVTMNQAQGVLSMYINLGEIPNSVVTALSRDDPDFDAAREGLSMNILGSPRNDDGSRKVVDGKVVYTSNKGLSKRRAREYNTLMEGNSDYTPIADVEVRGNRARPTFVWVTEDGTVVHSYTPALNNDEVLYQGLDPSNSMRTVSVE